jgi:hypothetical protein
LAWDDGTDTSYELVGGAIVAMAPPSHAHAVIVGNAYAEVRMRLDDRAPCHSAVEAGIRLDQRNHYKADCSASEVWYEVVGQVWQVWRGPCPTGCRPGFG